MDKNTLIFMFVLFMISSKLWNITWSVGTSLLYIVIGIMVLNSISPETSSEIKNFVTRVINLDTSLITNGLANLSKFLLDLFNNSKNIIQESKDILDNQGKDKEVKPIDKQNKIIIAEAEAAEFKSKYDPKFKRVRFPTTMAQLATSIALERNKNQPVPADANQQDTNENTSIFDQPILT